MPSGIYKRKPLTEEHKRNISKGLMGHGGVKHTVEVRNLISEARKGKHNSPKTEFKKGVLGENNHNWRGGKKLAEKRFYNKRKNNLRYRLNKRISDGIYHSLKSGIKNGRSWVSLVDYNIEQLKRHLKSTMPSNYAWQDFLNGDLHIDHIIPVSLFNFNSSENFDFKRCWALDNLRLLEKSENHKKSDKLIKNFQLGLRI